MNNIEQFNNHKKSINYWFNGLVNSLDGMEGLIRENKELKVKVITPIPEKKTNDIEIERNGLLVIKEKLERQISERDGEIYKLESINKILMDAFEQILYSTTNYSQNKAIARDAMDRSRKL